VLPINPEVSEYFDYRDGKLFWKKKTYPGTIIGSEAGDKKKKGYRYVSFKGVRYQTHRLVWFLHNGCDPDGQIDHINGVRDDNHIENLRVVTSRQNQSNLKRHREGYLLGATYESRGVGKPRQWRARIRVAGKLKHLGFFKSENEAHLAYMKALSLLEEFGTLDNSTLEKEFNVRFNRNDGLKGTTFEKSVSKWKAHICVNGKLKHIGMFNSEEEAHVAYLEAQKKIQSIETFE